VVLCQRVTQAGHVGTVLLGYTLKPAHDLVLFFSIF
jgi:hypothetical protein